MSSATTVTSLITDNPFDLDAILLNCFCHLLSVSNSLILLDSPRAIDPCKKLLFSWKLQACHLIRTLLLWHGSLQQESAYSMLASTHEQEVMFSEKKKHRANTNIKNSQKYLLAFATQGTECTSGTGNRVLYIAPKEVTTPFCFFYNN